MTIEITSRSEIPDAIDSNLRLEQVQIRTTTIRAIGDAAPGDGRTTKLDHRLRWNDETTPSPLTFDEAPTGLYSTIEVRIGPLDGADAFDLEGEARVDGRWYPFNIESTGDVIEVALPIDIMLAPGGESTIKLEIDFASVLREIDFDDVRKSYGRLTIDDDSPEMELIRTRLRAAFSTAVSLASRVD